MKDRLFRTRREFVKFCATAIVTVPLVPLLQGCGSDINNPEASSVDLVDCNKKSDGKVIKPTGSLTVTAPNANDQEIIQLPQGVTVGTDSQGNLSVHGSIPIQNDVLQSIQPQTQRLRFGINDVSYQATMSDGRDNIPIIQVTASCTPLPGR